MYQTAVEYLVNYLEENFHLTDEAFLKFKEAKEMEKQQIINAYQAGDGDAYNLDYTNKWGEEFYNETYGK